jgi:DHA1 family multidrug resistance protein-like MFS transporter
MSKKQILALFVCSLVPWTVGNGLVPLLPVYATQLGADPAAAGYYLAFSYFALAVGAVAAGWLSDRLGRRKMPLIVAGLAGIPIAWLIGRVGNIWGLSVLTAMLWFCGGLGLALIGILTGLSAGDDERGKIFGILSLTGGLGALIGGLATGFIVDRWGFPAMFTAVAVFLILWPLAGMFLTEKEVERVRGEDRLARERSRLGKSYHFLFAASLVASVAGFVIVLGRSLLMSDLGFGAMAIASTGAVGGIVAMPLPLLMGWLSDRTGRKVFLYLGYLAGIASLSVLAVSTSLWHFCIVLVLQATFMAVNATVGNALVTDLVSRESLGRGLSLFGATGWMGGVLGFAGAGYALQRLGMVPTFIIGICLTLIAIVLLIPIRSGERGHGAIAHSGNRTV